MTGNISATTITFKGINPALTEQSELSLEQTKM